MARSERFELPTLGIEIRCSIQLSYERVRPRGPNIAFSREVEAGRSKKADRFGRAAALLGVPLSFFPASAPV